MSKPIESRAVAACVEYLRAKQEVESLGRQIGEALSRCPNSRFDSPEPTHLSAFYKAGDLAYEFGPYGYGGTDYRAEFEACDHCMKADELIQKRKSARQTLGAAKRQIARIAKEAA
jgi:hypothetical protein